MKIAYVNYGSQSGVTANIVRGLETLGHRIQAVDPTGLLTLRDPQTRLPRPTKQVLLSLAVASTVLSSISMNRAAPTIRATVRKCGRGAADSAMARSV